MSKTYLCLLIFITALFVLYNLMPKRIRWTVLLAGSYVLNWYISGYLAVYLLISTAVIYLVGLWLDHYGDKTDAVRKALPKEERKQYREKCAKGKRLICAVAVLINFSILAVLKYSGFFIGSLNSVTGLDIAVPDFITPLGISYYTLMAVSYCVDVCRGKYRAERNFAKVALFVAYFPQLTEGPIGRFDHLAPQLYEGKSFSYENLTNGLLLALFGVFKKFVIADRANALVGALVSADSDFTGPYLIVGVVAYTLMLYCEFSGFIDIVSGISRCFGFELAKNFERPFFSKSVSEFWRRWHITLGTWTKDYVFYPVSLSKPLTRLSKFSRAHLSPYYASIIPNAAALLIVWLFTGIWHGADVKYVVYGLYYYVIMLIGMLLQPLLQKLSALLRVDPKSKLSGAFAILRTLVFVNFGMLMFKCDTITMAFSKLFAIFSLDNCPTFAQIGLDLKEICVLIAAVFLLILVEVLQEKGVAVRRAIAQRPLALRWAIYLAFITFIIIFGAYGDAYAAVDPIYAQF